MPDTTIYNTALYMRLSRDDENYGDSVSIETQRTILQQYAKEQGLHVVGEYVDDGWSGTNFERPDFQRMMDDMEAGKVNCIVTKDLSRFGREHVMMDYYLEFLFPEKRVRYIAVAENEKLEARAKASEKGKMKDTMERAKLKSELDNLQRLVDRIPPDILAELKRQQRHTVKER